MLVHELVERQVATNPDAVAVVDGTGTLSYAALDARAAHWAARLRAFGAGPEALVGVHLERSAELLAVLLGVLKAGAGYLPLDPGYPRERLELLVDDLSVRLLVSDAAGLRLTTTEPVTVLAPDADLAGADVAGAVAGPDSVAVGPDNVACVLYTSGSTGRPKGAGLTHRNLTDLLARVRQNFGADLDRVLAATSVCFDCSVLEIFGPLSRGGAVVVAETAMDVATRPEAQGVRLVHAVPSVLDELLRTNRLPASVRTAIAGGERLLPGVVERIYASSSIQRLVNLYGPTECTTYSTLADVERSPVGPPSIGRPAGGTRVYLLDERNRPVRVGREGEVYIAGAGVSRGYLNRPGLTADRFVPDRLGDRPGQRAYRTGDVAYQDERGELHFVGRVDDQIKVRGVRIEPAEVEQALLGHPDVVEVAVVSTGAGSRQRLTAHLVTARPLPAAALRAFAATRLPRSLRPDEFVFTDRLPRTGNGKVDRRRLRPAATSPGPAAPGCALPGEPRTEVESLLVTLWAGALERSRIGVDDDVFDLGGHSLLALGVRAGLMQALVAELPVRPFFEHRTVATLATAVERLLTAAAPAPDPASVATAVVAARRTGAPVPLSPNQRAILARAQADPTEPGLVFPLVVRLAGAVAPASLATAFDRLVRRHDSVRMRVVSDPDGPHQMPEPAHPMPLSLVDLTALDRAGIGSASAERVAHRQVAGLLARPFDLTTGPLLRAAVFRLGADDHVVATALHHLAADAWSIETLSHQLLGGYAAGIHGRPDATATDGDGAVPVQYAELAAAQVDRLAAPAGQAQLAYWRSRLAGLPILGVPPPGHRDAPAAPARIGFTQLPAAVVDRLAAVSRAASATTFMALLAGYAVLLHRHTGQTDLAVGVPTSGRDQPGTATVLGPCDDALVIRVDLGGDPSFAVLVRRVAETALDAYSHPDVPFAVLAEQLRADGYAHPLFQASIVLQQRPSLLDPAYSAELMSRQPIGNVWMSGFADLSRPPTALDLELAMFDNGDGLEAVLTGRADVLDESGIERLAARLGTLLAELTAHPDRPLSELEPSDSGADQARSGSSPALIV